MTTKVQGTSGVEFPDATVQGTAADKGPAFSAYNGNATLQTVAGWQTLPLVTELFDTDNAYNAGVATFQPQVAGYYQICVSVSVTPATRLLAGFLKNGTVLYQGSDAASGYASSCSALVYMNGTTDYLVPQVYTTGVSIVAAGEGLSFVTGALVRRT